MGRVIRSSANRLQPRRESGIHLAEVVSVRCLQQQIQQRLIARYRSGRRLVALHLARHHLRLPDHGVDVGQDQLPQAVPSLRFRSLTPNQNLLTNEDAQSMLKIILEVETTGERR